LEYQVFDLGGPFKWARGQNDKYVVDKQCEAEFIKLMQKAGIQVKRTQEPSDTRRDLSPVP
jgi:hypothetical protein